MLRSELQCQQISTLFPYTTLFRSVLLPIKTVPALDHRVAIVRHGDRGIPQFRRARQVWPENPTCEDTREFLDRSEEHTSQLQSRLHLVCRLQLEKKNKTHNSAAAE